MTRHEQQLHDLKTWPEFFQAVLDGRKKFEVRRDDRGYRVGDELNLSEWDPRTETYTGRELIAVVTYMLQPEPRHRSGAPAVILSIDVRPEHGLKACGHAPMQVCDKCEGWTPDERARVNGPEGRFVSCQTCGQTIREGESYVGSKHWPACPEHGRLPDSCPVSDTHYGSGLPCQGKPGHDGPHFYEGATWPDGAPCPALGCKCTTPHYHERHGPFVAGSEDGLPSCCRYCQCYFGNPCPTCHPSAHPPEPSEQSHS